MTDDFRRRCESALTHPVTLGAVAVLLVNDLVLKALWPNPWTTGKLSDLAWMVFALPLLAYLLSFAAGWKIRGQRAAFGVAYVGLPLLYAAFNTFAPLHGWIMQGFSIVSGSARSSPLDPWDSVVIPFAIGVALWVWRRDPIAQGGLRSRAGMIAAGLAAFATVATSPHYIVQGITNVEADSGVIAAFAWDTASGGYVSEDGGLTWSRTSALTNWEIRPDRYDWLETPRGKYRIEGPNIVLSTASGESVEYSTTYLQDSHNEWLQAKQAERWPGRSLAFAPWAITYDPPSGNLVVAMGIQGAIVGTPEGEWVPVAVGDFVPVDSLSSARKAGYLLSSYNFWIAALAFPMSMVILAFFIAHSRLRDPSGTPAFVVGPFARAAMLFLVALSILLLFSVDLDPARQDSGGTDPTLDIIGFLKFFAAALVMGVGIGYLVTTRNRLRIPKLWATLGSYIAMIALVALPFLAWLLLGISAWFASMAAFTLCFIIALALIQYLILGGHSYKVEDEPES